ncbi:MAG: sigma-54-dependent Fis family transcriptional regulator [Nitrospinae bacterium]|nr:sigma-54-dependent Fis family transcriptional regulator [Nitrospinota bacterium]
METPLILIVDDEPDNLEVLESRLTRRNYRVVSADSGVKALKLLEEVEPDMVLLDVMMPGMDGFETLTRMKEMRKGVFMPIILVTAQDDKESRIKGLDTGADDYVTKPVDIDELMARIRAMLRIKDLKRQITAKDREISRLSRELKETNRYQDIIGASAVMKELGDRIRGAAGIGSPVLIEGESGTGKELVAKGIHYASTRAERPFIAVNCAALPSELIESELFGHRKGAFTGAMVAAEGLFKAADGGTIFLDEITEMPVEVQAKMLRVLQEGTVRPVGGTGETPINVRVVAATNIDVGRAVKEGKLREDLYYRINVLNIKLPPLRARKEDIPLLAQGIIERLNARFGRRVKGISAGALAALARHDWPGNVRELQNVIERCFSLPDIEVIEERHIQIAPLAGSRETPAAVPVPADGGDVLSLDEAEKKLILSALAKTGNNKLKAAQLLGIHRSRLYKKLERYGIKD